MKERLQHHGRWYWQRWTDGRGGWTSRPGQTSGPPGGDLAALRRGTGRQPGTVPSMWPFQVVELGPERHEPRSDGWAVDGDLAAEHHALVLYGTHQQSQRSPVHRTGIGVGTAVRALHSTFSQEAVDRRFFGAVTADAVGELAHHLRGLVNQMRSLKHVQPLDYDVLVEDLAKWSWRDGREQVRRRWGLQYHARNDAGEESTDLGEAAEPVEQ